MTADRIYVFLHILGAFMIVGGAVAGALLYAAIRRTSEVAQLELLLRISLRVPMITMPGALIAIITGTLLAMKLGLNMGALWLSASYMLWFIVVALSAAVLGPAVKAAHTLALKDLADGKQTASEALTDAIASPRIRLVSRVLEASLLVFLYLMVFRPGA